MKIFQLLEVTSKTLPLRKSQFHPSRNNLKQPGKICTALKNSYPLLPPCENCLTITETTIELNLNPSRKIPTHREKISTPYPLKKLQPSLKISQSP